MIKWINKTYNLNERKVLFYRNSALHCKYNLCNIPRNQKQMKNPTFFLYCCVGIYVFFSLTYVYHVIFIKNIYQTFFFIGFKDTCEIEPSDSNGIFFIYNLYSINNRLWQNKLWRVLQGLMSWSIIYHTD